MDQVTVPQFIYNEDKILGPITVRQFVIMFVAAIILFLFYKFADFITFVFACIPIGGTAAIFGFVKINGQPFHFFLLHIMETLKRPSLRVWRKSVPHASLFHIKTKPMQKDFLEEIFPTHPMLPQRKLSELSLIVDTGGAYRGEGGEEEVTGSRF